MRNVSYKASISDAAVVASIGPKTGQLVHQRLATALRLSGYPSALHSIGRLQRQIKLGSFNDLLRSLHKIHHIASITADVIESMDGTKVDRHQLDRTQVVTYVQNIVDHLNSFTPSADEVDLMAYLITSFEANSSAWTLQGGDPSDDLHAKFVELYKSIHEAGPTSGTLHVYSPHSRDIVPFRQEYGGLVDVKVNKPKRKRKSKESVEIEIDEENSDNAEGQDRFAAKHAVYKYACIRIVDHVYQLMLDKDIWYAFVAPREKADVMTNLERAKSLRNLSIYCHSLLTYHQFFMLEAFLKSYDLVQGWIMQFPPLDVETQRKLEGTIRKYDLLGAKQDAERLISSFVSSDPAYKTIFPREFLAAYGIAENIDEIVSKLSRTLDVKDITDLASFDNPTYLPMIAGVATDQFDISYSLTKILLMDKLVSRVVEESMSAMLPSLVGGAAETSVTRFKGLGIAATLPFLVPHAASWNIAKGAKKGIYGGQFHLDSASPSFSYGYHQFVRDDLRLKFFLEAGVANVYKSFTVPALFDFERSQDLRNKVDRQWRGLYPAAWHEGDLHHTYDTLSVSPESVRVLIESLTGRDYTLVMREMTLYHIAQLTATFFSSFCLLYRNGAETITSFSDLTKSDRKTRFTYDELVAIYQDKLALDLVEGYGRPYGTSYSVLESKQGDIKNMKFISLGSGFYIALLTKVPTVSFQIAMEPTFYNQYPVLYCPSNSNTIDVGSWVIGDGLLHLAMVPNPEVQEVPSVMFTAKNAYMTNNLYLNTDIYYRPSTPTPTREAVPVETTERNWSDERRQLFVTYRTFGSYGSAGGANIPVPELDENITAIVEKVEKAVERDKKEDSEVISRVADNVDKSGEAIAREVHDGMESVKPVESTEKKRAL